MKSITLILFSFLAFCAMAQDNEALIKACAAGDIASVKKKLKAVPM
jgi:hypothetical protein